MSLGLGMNAYPEFVYGYNLTRNKEHYFSLIAKHYSAKTDIPGYTGANDVENTMMENNLALSYKRMKHKYTFFGSLDYSYNAYQLFGGVGNVEVASLAPRSDSQNIFSTGVVNLGYLSNYKDSSKINHKVDLSYVNFFDEENNMEHQVKLDGDMKKWIDKDLLRVDINALYVSGFGNVAENTTFNLIPTIERTKGKLSVEIGGGISGNLENPVSKVMLVPRLNASYKIVGKVLNVFANADGGYDRLTYMNLAQINPYSRINGGFRTRKVNLEFSAGLRGAFSKRMTYKVAYKYLSVDNDYLFVNSLDWDNSYQLQVRYDNVTTNQFNGEISHDGEKWKNVLYGEYNLYNTESEVDAWHRPKYQIKYNTTYNLQNKINVGMDVFFVSSRLVSSPTLNSFLPETSVLSSFADINFNVKYNYNKNLQAFVRLNNVLNNDYQMWHRVPNFGFNFLAGANYKF